jgi:uncharacterized protein DUF4136
MRLRAWIPFLVLAAAAACSTLRTSVDYDRSLDFTRYRTFAFATGTPARREFTQWRIEQLIAGELRSRGMIPAARERSDLLVFTHAVVERQQRIETVVWGYGCRWGGGVASSTVTAVPVGTLIVDLVDHERNCLVWQGRATDTLASESETREEQLREAVTRLFAGFPGRPDGYRNRRELPD